MSKKKHMSKSKLLGDSPHLSDEVLREMADRTDVLPDDIIMEILTANPDEIKIDLITYMEEKTEPLPAYMISILEQQAQNPETTYKTILLNEMDEYYTAKSRAAHDIIRHLQADSIYEVEELRNWYDNLSNMNADRQIISTYLQEDNVNEAQYLLSILPAVYNLQGEELTEHNDYAEMINFNINLKNQNRTITELTIAEIDELSDKADNGIGQGQMMAQNILQSFYGYRYCNCAYNDDGSGGGKGNASDPVIPKPIKDIGLKVEVAPNPSGVGQWITIFYELPANVNEAKVILIDMSGKEMLRIDVFGNVGQKTLDTRNLSKGTYLYKFITQQQIKTDKIIIK